MLGHKKFPKIPGFVNVVKTFKHMHDPENPQGALQFRPKIKLHGTNAGVRIEQDGTVVAQARNDDRTEGHFGFAQWVKDNETYFRALGDQCLTPKHEGMIVYGEWAGPGVQAKVAVSQIPEKQFFVFAIRIAMIQEDDRILSSWITHPVNIGRVLNHVQADLPETLHIIPWHSETITITFSDHDDLDKNAELMNAEVEAIDAIDPYIKAKFGIEAHGEGLVYYPITKNPTLFTSDLERLCFKVKGASHQKGNGGEKKAKVGLKVSPGAYSFADDHVHDARLAQAIEAVVPEGEQVENKHVGLIIGWVCKDIADETQLELEASGLTWKGVQGVIAARTRTAVFNRIKENAFSR